MLTFLLVCLAVSQVQSLSFSSNFIWRGNVLRLKPDPKLVQQNQLFPFKFNVDNDNNDDNNDNDQFTIDNCSTYPLLPEARVAFPFHRQLVFSNEMKFRELMSDTQSMYSNGLIRCYVDTSGAIESIGLLCHIIESRSLKNGQAMYIIESEKKIMIENMHIKLGKSYLTSRKISSVDEELLNNEEIEINEVSCQQLFRELKKYLRLTRLKLLFERNQNKVSENENNDDDTDDDEDVNQYVCLSPNVMRNKPGQKNYISNTNIIKMEIHNNFSYAVGNLVSLSPYIAHQLLIGTTVDRLTALYTMVKSATTEMKIQLSLLSQKTLYEPTTIAMIQKVLDLDSDKYNDDNDADEDLSPPIGWKELSLDLIELEDDDDELLVLEDEGNLDIMQ